MIPALPFADRPLRIELARRQRQRILDRTAAGLDLHGYRFQPYTTTYQGRRAASGHTTTPNLMLTGDMLGGLRFTLTSSGVSLHVTTPFQAIKANANQVKRPFFGISAADSDAILQDLAELLTAL